VFNLAQLYRGRRTQSDQVPDKALQHGVARSESRDLAAEVSISRGGALHPRARWSPLRLGATDARPIARDLALGHEADG
jgi:hypothetical protein